MRKDLFEQLVESVEEMNATRAGRREPSRITRASADTKKSPGSARRRARAASVKSHKYELVIWWSDEDRAFVVDVPELPGCMAHGSTLNAAVANSQDAISFWLEVARETKRAVPRPRRRR